MSDATSIRITKDKRHKSSSSLAGVSVEVSRSERRLEPKGSFYHELNGLIPEDDQFALAEIRCDELQGKIDYVKSFKKKRKLKKRSITKLPEHTAVADNIPIITVRTQPKRKVSQADRLRRVELPPRTYRAHVDPATTEQHRMIAQFRGYNEQLKKRGKVKAFNEWSTIDEKTKRRDCPHGDAQPQDTKSEKNVMMSDCSTDLDMQHPNRKHMHIGTQRQYPQNTAQSRQHNVKLVQRSKPIRNAAQKEHVTTSDEDMPQEVTKEKNASRMRPQQLRKVDEKVTSTKPVKMDSEERPVLELFNKDRNKTAELRKRQCHSPTSKLLMSRKVKDVSHDEDRTNFEPNRVSIRQGLRANCRHHHYELPTHASQLKQSTIRSMSTSVNRSNIPFVVSKSTAPSHNIGVNLQKVLSGIKNRHPLSGIPSTLAHHLGLGHIPFHGPGQSSENESAQNPHMNLIKFGPRQIHLPSYKSLSYNRILNMYRQGNDLISKFLNSVCQPHYFYTSMYNLATKCEDFDAATSKGQAGNQDARLSLEEYTSLFREYEKVDKLLNDGCGDQEMKRKRKELANELAAREEHVRRVMQDYKPQNRNNLRSASVAEDSYRTSTFKLSQGDGN